MGFTIAEKILSKASGTSASAGDFVEATIDAAMVSDYLRQVLRDNLQESGITEPPSIPAPERFVVALDHFAPAPDVQTASDHKIAREFARKYGIKNFYDIREGIAHQVFLEKGHARPGMLIVGADSHTTTYGALNAAGTGIGFSEMSYVFLTGKLWFRVPETIRFVTSGKLPVLVSSKDIMLHILGEHGSEIAQYKSIEFSGPTIQDLSLPSRIVMSNMSVELGAKFGIFEADQKAIEYVSSRTNIPFVPVQSDRDATFERTYPINVENLEPQVACPHDPTNVKPISEIGDIPIDQAFIGSCTNGRLEDLRIAARILGSARVHPEVRMLVSPASRETFRDAMKEGILEVIHAAGAIVCNPTCGPCGGSHLGLLAPGERCVSSTNRNFKGRMGSPKAEVYLGSPATVAASAVKGKIFDPRRLA